MSYDDAAAVVTAPGQAFEVADATIRGVRQRIFVHAPTSLRDLYAAARSHGDRTFLVYEDKRWSFADVMANVDALAAALVDTSGIRKGDRVAIGMRNLPEWVISFAAVTSIGAVSVSLNAWWTDDELGYALSDSGARLLIADRERVARAAAACDRLGTRILAVRSGSGAQAGGAEVRNGAKGWKSAAGWKGPERWEDEVRLGPAGPDVAIDTDDDATILYTSGTTGPPKGAVSTHRAVLQALFGFGCRAAIDQARDPERTATASDGGFILIVPLFHVTGCVPVMLSCFALGMKLVIMRRWDPERALQLIERERVTNFVGVPTRSWDLLESPRFAEHDTSSLRSVGGGGAPAPPTLVSRIATSFRSGGPIIGYGLTETNGYGTGNAGADYLTRPTSTGRATPIVQVAVRDPLGLDLPAGVPGEIWLKGPNLIRGYWNQPESTAATLVEGWLRTGGIGHLDDEGFLFISDRLKDMILRSGENVYCAEVEAALYEHPGVHEAAVFGVPHERLGGEVAAVVVTRPGATASVEDLHAHVAGRLAAFKVPTRLAILTEALPRNAAGKIIKRQLRSTFED